MFSRLKSNTDIDLICEPCSSTPSIIAELQSHGTESATPCHVCVNLDPETYPEQWQSAQVGSQLMIEYFNLRQTAEQGCESCSIIDEGIRTFKDVLGPIGADTVVYVRCKPGLPLEIGVAEHERAGARWLEFFSIEGQSIPRSTVGKANYVPRRLDLQVASKQVEKWLQSCHEQSHVPCRHGERKRRLPTRVLDLGKNPSPEDPIKLFQNGRSHTLHGTYMTLSHCWGSVQLITTTRENIKSRIAGIRMEDLPQTFRDAVFLTRRLGIRYLWIDSLCIIQKDTEDWEIEAARMGTVYRNSFLNIAATGSSQGSGGCFRERVSQPQASRSLVSPVHTHEISRPCLGDNKIHVRPSLRVGHEALARRGLLNGMGAEVAPLLSRAWVYQERVSAPRTIHFHGTEMMWECNLSSRCECGHLDRQRTEVFRPRIFQDQASSALNEEWCSVVQQYSGLNATYSSDKLPALSGLAERFHHMFKLNHDNLPSRYYLAGLWRDHILRGLQWVVADGNKACRKQPYRAPTWSWASLDKLSGDDTTHHGARVTYHLTLSIQQDKHFVIDSADVLPAGKNPYGGVQKGGSIILNAGYYIPAKIELEIDSWEDMDDQMQLVLSFDGLQKPVYVDPDVALDPMSAEERNAICDAGRMRWLVLGKNTSLQFGLLVRQIDENGTEFERFGLKGCPLTFDLGGGGPARVSTFKIV